MKRAAGDVRMLEVAGGPIEYVEVPGDSTEAPLVFLHEGLGCLELWRSFPHDLCAATRRKGLVFSRHGYGRSGPSQAPRKPDYMHHEALVVLPEILDRLALDRPVLIGHSDGASIALIHAGAGPGKVSGLVLLAPHVFVEDRSIEGIVAARKSYLNSGLRERMARYHADPDATFAGWNDIWLSPEFRDWNIESVLPSIACPVLVVQGLDDPYGTVAQVEAIKRGVNSAVRCRLLADTAHTPHLERAFETATAVRSFIDELPS